MTPEGIAKLQASLNRVLYCERVTRILCRRTGPIADWQWPAPKRTKFGGGHRLPPLPFHSTFHRGAGTCRVCGQPIYGGGSFRSFAGPVSKRLTWHNVCTTAYFMMSKPASYAAMIILRQGSVCPISGDPLNPMSSYVEIDHEIPLFRVARDHAAEPWHELMRFWMSGNLRAITPAAHKAKCRAEARERAGHRPVIPAQEVML